MQSTIISIYGNSDVGKSTLANAIVNKLGPDSSCRLRGDYYLKSRGNIELEEFLGEFDQYDWDLVNANLSKPIGIKLFVPNYDFNSFQRLNGNGDKDFKVSDIMVVDSIAPCPFADLKIFITLENDARKERVLNRDRGVMISNGKKLL